MDFRRLGAGSTRLVLFAVCMMAFFASAAVPSYSAGLESASTGPVSAPAGELAVSTWLVAAPVAMALPALHGEAPHTMAVKDLLEQAPLDLKELWPSAGKSWHWTRSTVKWQELHIDGAVLDLAALWPSSDPEEIPRQALAAFYLEVPCFTKPSLQVECGHLLQLYLDGVKLKEKTTTEGGDQPDSLQADLDLTQGKHLVVLRALYDPNCSAAWSLKASLKVPIGSDQVSIDLSPRHTLRLRDLLDARSIGGLQLSNDGRYLAYRLASPGVPSDDRNTWWEIRATKDGHLVRSFEGENGPSSFSWLPGSEYRYSFTTAKDGKATLWVAGLDGSSTVKVLDKIERFGSYRWLSDGSGAIYTVREKGEKKHEDFKHYQNLADRWSDYRDKAYLYLAPYPAGAPQRLTAGIEATGLLDVSPDGQSVLFSRELFDKIERPFSITEYYELDVNTLQSKRILQSKWVGGAAYSPDGKTIAVQGGPEAFGRAGVDLPEGIIPNDYDEQLYLFDRATGEVKPITREFDPSIRSFSWSKSDGALYCTAETQSRILLYRFDPKKNHFEQLNTAENVTTGFALSRDGKDLAYIAESSIVPERIFVQKTQVKAKPRLLADPNGARFDLVEFGQVEDWNFTASDGTEIIGRVYYPPGFDSSTEKKWPCIVYYYGGTSPITRDFGGRYPKNYWAANGFVVYVLQPSGATGFGQEFSARHVNDWGKHAGQDILEGTKKFLAAHEFVDPARVGCLGASYGGFMTEYLVSHSDLFAGAASHAGISFLGSYWGQGDWGAFYSAVATAGKYPWNAPEFYEKQGSLFSADQIHTPLLLLHGDIDNNVPPGESEQLYTALKVLGREVEFIRIGGERHWILKYPHRELWSRTIVAWFDRTLKGDRRWWDELWGEKKAE